MSPDAANPPPTYNRLVSLKQALSLDSRNEVPNFASSATLGVRQLLNLSLDAAIDAAIAGNPPFGAILVIKGAVVVRASNSTISDYDPSAHAEFSAIRAACNMQKTLTLEDAELYSSCEPCMMCALAIERVGIRQVFYCARREEAEDFGFHDQLSATEARRVRAQLQAQEHHVTLARHLTPFTAK
jgi:tRNA(Arg) A34 adenosine deaminase TadA